MKQSIVIILLIMVLFPYLFCGDIVLGNDTDNREVQIQTSRDLESFKRITMKTSIQEIIKCYGQPDRNVGSGISILVYDLDDGTSIWVGTANYRSILYLDHVSEKGHHHRILPTEDNTIEPGA